MSNSSSKTKRRRYQFPDRAAAEDAYQRSEAKQIELQRALNAITRKEVEYLPQIGPFKLGLYWLEKGNGHILLTQPRSNGASVIAMDFEDFLRWADGEAGQFEPHLRQCAYHARRVRSRVWRQDEPCSLAFAIQEEKPYIKEVAR